MRSEPPRSLLFRATMMLRTAYPLPAESNGGKQSRTQSGRGGARTDLPRRRRHFWAGPLLESGVPPRPGFCLERGRSSLI